MITVCYYTITLYDKTIITIIIISPGPPPPRTANPERTGPRAASPGRESYNTI